MKIRVDKISADSAPEKKKGGKKAAQIC